MMKAAATMATAVFAIVLSALCAEAGAAASSEGFLMGRQQLRSKRSPLRQLLAQSAQVANPGLLAPLPNDTISAAYWQKIDSAIADATEATPAPVVDKPTPVPWQQVFSATDRGAEITAQDLTAEEIANGQIVTSATASPMQDMSASAEKVGAHSVVPYDMQLGARIMYSFAPKPTASPPPSQMMTSLQFVSQCPMIMFRDALYIRAPGCSSSMGQWVDPATQRTILRWSPHSSGGMDFGVDSVIQGNGSVNYASLKQQFSLNGFHFQLFNCLSVMRYSIEETVVKVSSLGQGVMSSIQEHDISTAREAFFYKYTIRHPNGTAVAETGLFRLNQNEVNINMIGDELTPGPLIATATRQGEWTSDSWRDCSGPKREWQVTFHLKDRDVELPTTVMDIRVASAAVVNLMAFRDETVSESTGTTTVGERSMGWQLLITILWCLLVLIIIVLILYYLRKKGWDVRLRRICFKFEAVVLPKRPLWKRVPPLHATY
mmetsp:Transcript_42040/g.91654  ORF Transcript_42040/g.91654 Transcript_42040/m.91654 type:complete len:490 (+) Transcript_42040:117-1586(+)